MDAITATLTLKALDGLTARQVATAENIANAGTAGYRPARVDFEAALAAAASGGLDAINAVEPRVSREQPLAGEGLRLDLELATGSTTAARYAALVEVLNRQLQITALATQGNR
jgi:flagellar basal-body rod protein FlgB